MGRLNALPVSTHSRLKAAGDATYAGAVIMEVFQHTAA